MGVMKTIFAFNAHARQTTGPFGLRLLHKIHEREKDYVLIARSAATRAQELNNNYNRIRTI